MSVEKSSTVPWTNTNPVGNVNDKKIKTNILENGYNEKIKAFTMFYGSEHLDASSLMMLYYHFLDKKDPRVVNTENTINDNLREDFHVQRYKMKDDFGQSRSSFTICAFWLVDALFQIGEREKARELFSKLIKKGNHLGLFAEDIDIFTGEQRGNFPQAYVHIALINSSILLSEWDSKRKKIDLQE